jgi:hypothetical protein
MATLREAVDWIANNDDEDIGNDDVGYLVSIYLVADLFDREPWEIAHGVRAERQGQPWKPGRKGRQLSPWTAP